MLQDGIRASSIEQVSNSRYGHISWDCLNRTRSHLVATPNCFCRPRRADRFVGNRVKTFNKSISQKRSSICWQGQHCFGQCLDWNWHG
jgi:hypothetical protein